MKIVIPFELGTSLTIDSDVPETVAEYDAGATYATGDDVLDPATWHIFRSQVDGNTGQPLSDASKWVDQGPSNRTAMFDQKLGTATSQADEINVTMVADGRVTALPLLDLDASEVEVTVTDEVDGVVFNKLVSLVSFDNINDYWDYFFQPVIRITDLVVTGLPLYAGAEVLLSIRNPGGIARIGDAVPGMLRALGETEWGFSIGNIDSSLKKVDDFGTVTFVERPSRRTGSFTVEVARRLFDETARLLDERRSKPTVFIGTESFGKTLIYGFVRNWSQRMNYYHRAELTLEVEGFN